MKKLVMIYDHIEEIILVVMFLFMTVVTFLQVFMRYVMNESLPWPDEMARFIFVWLTWLGISIGQKKGEHIKITMLTDKLPFKTARIVNLISCLIVIVICAITTYYTFEMMGTLQNAVYVSIKISYVWGYLAIPLGCILMTLRTLKSMYISVKELKTGEDLTTPALEGGAE